MEKIVIVHLVGVNAVTGIAPGDPQQVGTNDFKNINIIETL